MRMVNERQLRMNGTGHGINDHTTKWTNMIYHDYTQSRTQGEKRYKKHFKSTIVEVACRNGIVKRNNNELTITCGNTDLELLDCWDDIPGYEELNYLMMIFKCKKCGHIFPKAIDNILAIKYRKEFGCK